MDQIVGTSSAPQKLTGRFCCIGMNTETFYLSGSGQQVLSFYSNRC